MYNLPLKLILDKLTDIDNKLALLVENNQSIDMLEEMRMEEEKEKNGRTIRRKDKQKRS